MTHRSKRKEELIGQFATVLKPSDDTAKEKVEQSQSQGDKKTYLFPKYWIYESYDPNDGRGEVRLPKR